MSDPSPLAPPRRRALAEIAVGPHLLSPSFIAVNLLWGAILSFTLSNDIVAGNSAAHLLSVIAAQAIFSTIIAWGYRWNEAKGRLLSGRLFIFVFVVAGAIRGLLLQFLLSAMELSDSTSYLYRVYTGITSVGFAAWFWAVLFGIIGEWRRQSGRLAAERRYLSQLQNDVDNQVSAATQLEIDAFKTYLLANLRVSEKTDASRLREELLTVISTVIKPVVDQMLSRRTAVEVPKELDVKGKVHFENVLSYVSVRQSIQPLVQVLPATPAAIAASAVLYSYPGFIAAFVAFALIWPATLAVLKYTLAPLLDRGGPAIRLVGVLVVAGLAAIPPVSIFVAIPTQGEISSAPIEFTVYAVVTALVLTIWNSYLSELTRVYRAREEYLKHIHWKAAEVNSRRWHQQLYFARRVHGALQSEVAAVAIRLEQEMLAGDVSAESVSLLREGLQERIEGVFSTQPDVANPMDVLSEIAETWGGICRVSIALGHDDAKRIMSDPIAVETALEIVREGISNAIRHGNAENVWVSLSLPSDDLVRIEVVNDGVGLEVSDREGMGTKYLQECSAFFSIKVERDRTHLIAEIPFRS